MGRVEAIVPVKRSCQPAITQFVRIPLKAGLTLDVTAVLVILGRQVRHDCVAQ